MPDDTQPKLSIRIALEALSEAADDVSEARTRLENARAYRDRLIKEAYGTIPVQRLARLTGLSREAIYKIGTGGERK